MNESRTRTPKVVVSWWLALLESLLVRYVKVDDEWLDAVWAAAAKGPVVFVLRNRSLVDLLCIRGLARRHGLPPLGFVAGLSTFLFMPLWLWVVRLFRRRRPERRRRKLAETLAAGGSALVFLRRPAAVWLGSRPVAVDGIRLAVEVQRELGLPVQALPTVIIWGEDPMRRANRGGFRFVLGTNDYPRLIRSLWMLVRRRSIHGAWVGEPLDLSALRREREVGDEALAGIVRAGVGRHIELIRRTRLGSLTKSSSRIKAEVLGSGRLKAELAAIAAEEGIPAADVPARARQVIRQLATDFRPRVLTLFAAVMAFVWRRLYSGIDVREEDLERLRVASGLGPLLILPCHKSHIDYLVISQVMRDANIMLPHIAAGENLSFWPLGPLFRSSGAFFIRRKFILDRFYTAVVNAYIRRLLQEGYSLEVFIEGGRSRTGKLLRPKLGMLEMVLKAMASSPLTDPGVLPMFIGYERVIEERAYVDESVGRPKQRENVAGLFKTTGVLFHRYGRLHVRTGNHFTFGAVLARLGVTREQLLDGHTRREVAQEIALDTLREIGRVAVATPSAILASALLAGRGGRLAHAELRRDAIRLAGFLRQEGAARTALVDRGPGEDDAEQSGDTLDHIIAVFIRGGRISARVAGASREYEIAPGQRLPLDYYKNNTVHFFVPAALAAATLLAASGGEATADVIAADIADACRLYRWEFLLPEQPAAIDAPPASAVRDLADRGIAALARGGIAATSDSTVRIVDRERAHLLRDLLRGQHETYHACLTALRDRASGVYDGDSTRRARLESERMLAAGRYLKPEGPTRLNLQSAMLALKDLKLSRPPAGERPFDEGQLGERLIRYLERALIP
ncbi:MAG TPA: 1-acyl-sn-glycerol-3-phosphate acyltransferase [Polyangia bacterium]|nr:1-acyl-sn-glycerol-3-phosphate acyltransferase [Polyangia bacterium]